MLAILFQIAMLALSFWVGLYLVRWLRQWLRQQRGDTAPGEQPSGNADARVREDVPTPDEWKAKLAEAHAAPSDIGSDSERERYRTLFYSTEDDLYHYVFEMEPQPEQAHSVMVRVGVFAPGANDWCTEELLQAEAPTPEAGWAQVTRWHARIVENQSAPEDIRRMADYTPND